MNELSETYRSKRGVAVLAACIVQTLNESDATFQERFLERLGRAYNELREDRQWEGDVVQELELFQWKRELLTGFSVADGRGKPFLDGQ